jgi:hypothetical protein
MFKVSVSVTVGDGCHTLFWIDNWLDGRSILQLALSLSSVVPKRTCKSRRVRDAIPQASWIKTSQAPYQFRP